MKPSIYLFLFLLSTNFLFAQNPTSDKVLEDTRDDTQYEIIKIQNLWWMNENLNYSMPDAFCYNNEHTNCETYGKLYTFDDAMEACPTGWRLPSEKEFEKLMRFIEGDNWEGHREFYISGTWEDWAKGNNKAGLKISPSGLKHKRKFKTLGDSANFWVHQPDKVREASHIHIYLFGKKEPQRLISFWHNHEIQNPIKKKRLFSVRCVREDSSK